MRTSGISPRHIVLAAVVLWVGLPAVSGAQSPASTFDQVPMRVRVGDTIYVIDSAGREQKGILDNLSPSSLVLLTDDARRLFTADEIGSISWRRPDSLANGALIGFGVGAGFAGLATLLACADEYCDAEWAWLGILVYGGVGTGIGVAIDALVPGKKIVVYQPGAARSSIELGLAPILTPRRQGLAVSLAF